MACLLTSSRFLVWTATGAALTASVVGFVGAWWRSAARQRLARMQSADDYTRSSAAPMSYESCVDEDSSVDPEEGTHE